MNIVSKNKIFDFTRVKPLFSKGLNSKYLMEMVWNGRGLGVVEA
jgi:hypothetical protein